ncbi:MAG: beta-agarase, partial [Bacteroidota bacterium]
VVDSVEEDLNYVAMQVRQVDADFNIVNTSAFQAVVSGDAPNAAEVGIDYVLPETFADGADIPLTAELPDGHRLLLLIFMSVNNDAGFANANTEIILVPKPDRERQVTFVNRATFIPTDSLLPQFEPGESFTAVLNYSTGVAGGVEEDLNYVAMQLRQVDADFNIINTSAFAAVVGGDAANADEVSIDYTLPTTFADGAAIPITPELPSGHKLILLIFMSVDGDAGFANANSEINIYPLPERDRMITFTNKAEFIPNSSNVPVFNPGETFTAILDYSTGVTNSVEEMLDFVGMRIRQEDGDGATVDRTSLAVLIGRDGETVAEEALQYTLPATFGGGGPIPLTADLPAGHRLVLEITLSVDNGAGFANDDTEIIISTTRERQVTFVNRASFILPGDSIPTFSPGQNV